MSQPRRVGYLSEGRWKTGMGMPSVPEHVDGGSPAHGGEKAVSYPKFGVIVEDAYMSNLSVVDRWVRRIVAAGPYSLRPVTINFFAFGRKLTTEVIHVDYNFVYGAVVDMGCSKYFSDSANANIDVHFRGGMRTSYRKFPEVAALQKEYAREAIDLWLEVHHFSEPIKNSYDAVLPNDVLRVEGNGWYLSFGIDKRDTDNMLAVLEASNHIGKVEVTGVSYGKLIKYHAASSEINESAENTVVTNKEPFNLPFPQFDCDRPSEKLAEELAVWVDAWKQHHDGFDFYKQDSKLEVVFGAGSLIFDIRRCDSEDMAKYLLGQPSVASTIQWGEGNLSIYPIKQPTNEEIDKLAVATGIVDKDTVEDMNFNNVELIDPNLPTTDDEREDRELFVRFLEETRDYLSVTPKSRYKVAEFASKKAKAESTRHRLTIGMWTAFRRYVVVDAGDDYYDCSSHFHDGRYRANVSKARGCVLARVNDMLDVIDVFGVDVLLDKIGWES